MDDANSIIDKRPPAIFIKLFNIINSIVGNRSTFSNDDRTEIFELITVTIVNFLVWQLIYNSMSANGAANTNFEHRGHAAIIIIAIAKITLIVHSIISGVDDLEQSAVIKFALVVNTILIGIINDDGSLVLQITPVIIRSGANKDPISSDRAPFTNFNQTVNLVHEVPTPWIISSDNVYTPLTGIINFDIPLVRDSGHGILLQTLGTCAVNLHGSSVIEE